MKRKKHLKNNADSYTLLYSDPNSVERMSERIVSWLPSFPREYIIVCIGTDRSTGDSLGPLTGTFLTKMNPKHVTIFGTLHKPVHAQNLVQHFNQIHTQHKNPYIIAIDACLGRSSSIGKVTLGTGPLLPGAALNKDLPPIGDLNITGVVNVSGFMEYAVLQNTRLSIVVDMATTIASILNAFDKRLTHQHCPPAIILPEFRKTDPVDYHFKDI